MKICAQKKLHTNYVQCPRVMYEWLNTKSRSCAVRSFFLGGEQSKQHKPADIFCFGGNCFSNILIMFTLLFIFTMETETRNLQYLHFFLFTLFPFGLLSLSLLLLPRPFSVVPSSLLQVLVNPSSLQGISSWTSI